MERIVVGVDGSEGGRRALRWAVDEALIHQATLVVVHAWALPVMAAPTGLAPLPVLSDYDELAAAAKTLIDHELAEVLAGRPDTEVQPLVVEPSPVELPTAEALLQEADRSDMVVLGSRGHGGFVGLLLGSISQHVVHHATCAVVVVPPPAKPR